MDGVGTPKEYAVRAKEIGMTSLACTDHGTLTCHRKFYDACHEQGIKPILGIEAYITEDRFDRRDNSERKTPLDLVYNHIILLAKNQEGLQNLGKLNEIAWSEGFYKKPRMDFETLEQFSKGIIVSSACASGLINKAIELDEIALAKKRIDWFCRVFGDDFYIEIMPHNSVEMNCALIDLADCSSVKVVVTPDCHHCTKDQKVIQEMMLILNTHTKMNKNVSYDESRKITDVMSRLDYLYGKDRPMSFNSFDIHLLSQEEMHEAIRSQDIYREDIYDNTNIIADSIEDYIINRNLNLLPVKTSNPDSELRQKAFDGLKSKKLDFNEEYIERLEFELKTISDKKLSPYFLANEPIGSNASDAPTFPNLETKPSPQSANLLRSSNLPRCSGWLCAIGAGHQSCNPHPLPTTKTRTKHHPLRQPPHFSRTDTSDPRACPSHNPQL